MVGPVKDDSHAQESGSVLEIGDLMRLLPHRYPFLLIDRMIDIVPGESAIGIKNVTASEPWFQGHFPSRPVMPGVLIVEAMAQTSAALVVHTLGDTAEGKLVYFMTIDEARFRRPVVPGDRLEVHVRRRARKRNVWKFKGDALVDTTLVAEASYGAMIMMNR